MLEEIIQEFLKTPSNNLAVNILKYTIGSNQLQLGSIFADYFSILFPTSIEIKEDYNKLIDEIK